MLNIGGSTDQGATPMFRFVPASSNRGNSWFRDVSMTAVGRTTDKTQNDAACFELNAVRPALAEVVSSIWH